MAIEMTEAGGGGGEVEPGGPSVPRAEVQLLHTRDHGLQDEDQSGRGQSRAGGDSAQAPSFLQ